MCTALKVTQICNVHSLYKISTSEFQFLTGSTVENIVVIVVGAAVATLAEVVSTAVCM
jgi:hypothetical protein